MKTATKEKPSQNSTQMPEKIQINVPSPVRRVGEELCYFLVSLLVSQTVIIGDLSPFGVAMCAGVGLAHLPGTLAGAFVGCFLTNGAISPYRYLGAVIATSLISLGLNLYKGKSNMQTASAINAFLCCAATGVALLLSTGFYTLDLMKYLCESVICGGSAYFLSKMFGIRSKNVKLKALPVTELAGLAMGGAIIFMALGRFQIGEFSPVRIVAVFTILVFARYCGVAGGVTVGAILGLSMGLSGNSMELVGAYSFAGLMAGLFSPVGQIGSGVAFLFCSVVIIVFGNQDVDVMPVILEIMGATIGFMIMPTALGNKLDKYINSKIDANPSSTLRNSVVVKLRFAASAMGGVSRSVESTSQKLKEISAPRYDFIPKNVCSAVCANCNLKMLCWQKESEKTINSFNKLFPIAKNNDSITLENAPGFFREKCIHASTVIDSYNTQYKIFCEKEGCQNALNNLRDVVADQFYVMSDMLYDLSTEFDQAEVYDLELADKVKMLLEDYGIRATDVSCAVDKFSRLRIEAHCIQPVTGANNRNLNRNISKLCGRVFEDVSITFAGRQALLCFCEKATFGVSVATSQYACNQGSLCGDCVEIISDGKGREILIISDGMGTGGRAAIDGAMASGLLSKLIKAGFGFDCSLRVVNSALLVKSSEESLATLDIVCIDLFSGKTDFYKAGASSSFVLKDEKVVKVELPSLPAGILREVKFSKASTFLSTGDKIVLFTDGVADSETAWLREIIANDKTSSPQELSDKILLEAKRQRQNMHEDDMTVVVAEIWDKSI